jgi:hypothetical protein
VGPGGGFFAVQIATGERFWQTPPPGCANSGYPVTAVEKILKFPGK